jgi:hypothetical protein
MDSGHISCVGGLIVENVMITDRMPHRGEAFTANRYRQVFGAASAFYADERTSGRVRAFKVELVDVTRAG